jgi:hypothetical protein
MSPDFIQLFGTEVTTRLLLIIQYADELEKYPASDIEKRLDTREQELMIMLRGYSLKSEVDGTDHPKSEAIREAAKQAVSTWINSVRGILIQRGTLPTT